MRRLLSWFIIFLCVFHVSCVKETIIIPVTGITLNSGSLSMVEGESSVLVATVSPKDADNQTVIWSSSDGSVASVNGGKISAFKAGYATITAKTDDGGYTASCSVTVVAKTIEVTSISLSKTELTLTEGDSETITAIVNPNDATDKTVIWLSSDSSIATVDDGKITAVKEGSTTIMANVGDKTADCNVEVRKKTTVKSVLYYTSSDGMVLDPYNPDSFDANIISNEYVEGRGILSFDGDVTFIGSRAFYNCTRLTGITIPDSVRDIGPNAFYNCNGLTEINIPDNVRYIAEFAFRYCSSLKSFSGKFASADGLYLIDSKSCLVAVALGAIDGEITVPVSVTRIGCGAFDKCPGLIGVTIPDSVTSIETTAFAECSNLAYVVIPNSVTEIGSWVFYQCNSLVSITIPENVTKIWSYAFSKCTNLTCVTVKPKFPPEGDFYMFDDTNNCPIYVPAESVEAYKSAPYWSDYADRIFSMEGGTVPGSGDGGDD